MAPYGVTRSQWVKPLRPEYVWGNIDMYLPFIAFFQTEMAQVMEIIPILALNAVGSDIGFTPVAPFTNIRNL